MNLTDKRHPVVPFRRVALDEATHERQVKRGLFTSEKGEPLAIPVDKLSDPSTFLDRSMWRQSPGGRVYRPGARSGPPRTNWQRKMLELGNKYLSPNFSAHYYYAVLGHDLHVSTFGDLYGRHWHRGWVNPFDPDRRDAPLDPGFTTLIDTHYVSHECDLPMCPAQTWPNSADLIALASRQWGFVEDLGWLSGAKVTDAFVSETIDELVSAASSEFADFDSHEVGTSSAAEDNSHTALQTTSGIARAAGTPTDSDPIYQSVATVTADATETWEEHGIFNNTTGAAMMDRNLTGGQAVDSLDEVEYTYQLTLNEEA